MPDRHEIRCSACGLVEVVEDGDQPAEMSLGVYTAWLGSDHDSDCFRGDVTVSETVDVAAETTKYDTGGALDGTD